ncbi:DUF5302 domain-containing protein [Streptomyces sp. NPDC002851]
MANTPQGNAADNDAKRKFREALERKARGGASRRVRDEGKVRANGTSSPAGGKRYFRRKTG